MDIGEPERVIMVEPLEHPFEVRPDGEPPIEVEPHPTLPPEREKDPAVVPG